VTTAQRVECQNNSVKTSMLFGQANADISVPHCETTLMQLCARFLEKAGSPVSLQFVRCNTLRLCQCVALPHSGGNVPENGVALGLSEPSSKTPSTGNEPLLPQWGGSVPVRGTSMMTRTERFGNAPGCAHVWGTVPANTTYCIGGKSALRLKGWAGARDAVGVLQCRTKCLRVNMHRQPGSKPAIRLCI